VVTVQGMFLRDLLPQYGIPSIAELRRRLGLRKQYAWLLWHGKIALSADMMRRLHGELGIPLEALMQIERAEPAKPRGRKPTQPPPEEPRADRFGWSDGDMTITDPPEEAQ
jgi:hypothetical protein